MRTLNRETTAIFKIFAIVSVVIAHVGRAYWGMSEQISNCFGTGGVAVFLFLSGYGLYQSAKRHGITTAYWQKKVQKVFFPYWLATILYVVLCRIPVSSSTLLQNLLTIDYNRSIDGTMWYLSLLMIFYLSFGVLFWAQIPTWGRISFLFLVATVVQNATIFGSCGWQFQQNSYIFPLGVTAAWVLDLLYKCRKKAPRGVQILVCCVLGAGCIVMYGWGVADQRTFSSINAWLVGGCLFYGLVLSNGLTMAPKGKKWIGVAGALTYPIYLVEGKVLDRIKAISALQNAWAATVTVILLILVTSIILYVLIQWIDKREKEKQPCPTLN